MDKSLVIGVLALQGDFEEHSISLKSLGCNSTEVRTVRDLLEVDALILPGGESTTISKLLKSTKLDKAIVKRVEQGMPVWGTCAGAILLAKNVISVNPLDTQLGLIDIDIERNAYGRQTESFVTKLSLSTGDQDALFIRAPLVLRKGKSVKGLVKHRDKWVMLSSSRILVTTFHSELSSTNEVLKFFIKKMIGETL